MTWAEGRHLTHWTTQAPNLRTFKQIKKNSSIFAVKEKTLEHKECVIVKRIVEPGWQQSVYTFEFEGSAFDRTFLRLGADETNKTMIDDWKVLFFTTLAEMEDYIEKAKNTSYMDSVTQEEYMEYCRGFNS